MSPRDQDFLEFVLDQLSGLRRVSSRRMFGAIGLYQDDHFFAIIDEGRLYFLTSETSRERYTARGMKPFEFGPGEQSISYYEVPVDILEDDGELRAWAAESVSVQVAKKGKKKSPGSRKKRKEPA